MATTNNKKHVGIIGGGLVGSLNACFMAKRGFRVSLFELRKDMRKEKHVKGRSINLALSARGLAALESVGLKEKVMPYGIPMYARMIHDRNGSKRRIPYGKSHQFILSVDRRKLNELLLSESEKHSDVKLHFEHKLKKCFFVEKPKTVFEMSNGESVEEYFDVILGNDGAFSAVRSELMKTTRFDFQQYFIPHGYMELTIPPNSKGDFAMESNCLHIWPRDEFMMIALPNLDRSFTTTLFMPFDIFESIHNENDLLEFFEKTFPDSIPLIGKGELIHSFLSRKALPLVSVKCKPYNKDGKVVIMGDAAHAMVPFYGQGMNAGFEDCLVLEKFLNECNNNFDEALTKYSQFRHIDAVSICDLAMYNYIEMRSLVNSKFFILRKTLDNILNWIFPNSWVPLYTMVSFSRTRYHECIENKKWQDKLLNKILKIICTISVAGLGVLVWNQRMNLTTLLQEYNLM